MMHINVAGNVVTVLKEAQNKLPQVTDIMNTVYEGADKGIEGIDFVNQNFQKLKICLMN